jgi:ABC-type lipoprotein export system ATPase subunit
MSLLEVENLHKTYRLGRVSVPVLRGAGLRVEEGEFVAVLGASGSGKSTMLHLIGGLDRPDRGASGGGGGPSGSRIGYQGRELGSMSTRELDRYRATQVGFVFQFYHLLPELSVLQNVVIASMVRYRFGFGSKGPEVRGRAVEILRAFGLAERLKHRPAELSGGERQRVAIARALINEPRLLLADEPTGNLDRKTGDAILDSLAEIRSRTGQTLVMVTHDAHVAARADRIVKLEDGVVVAEHSRPLA